MYWELELQVVIRSWIQAVSGFLTVWKVVATCYYLPHP